MFVASTKHRFAGGSLVWFGFTNGQVSATSERVAALCVVQGPIGLLASFYWPLRETALAGVRLSVSGGRQMRGPTRQCPVSFLVFERSPCGLCPVRVGGAGLVLLTEHRPGEPPVRWTSVPALSTKIHPFIPANLQYGAVKREGT